MKVSELRPGDRLKGLEWTWNTIHECFEDRNTGVKSCGRDEAQLLLEAFGLEERLPEKVEFEATVVPKQAEQPDAWLTHAALNPFGGRRVRVTVEPLEDV